MWYLVAGLAIAVSILVLDRLDDPRVIPSLRGQVVFVAGMVFVWPAVVLVSGLVIISWTRNALRSPGTRTGSPREP